MRRYNPFASAPASHNPTTAPSIPPTQTPNDHLRHEPSSPSSSLVSYIPSVPSVRKYLFSGSPSARTLSNASANDDHTDNDPAPDSLPQLHGMIDTAIGPVGHPHARHSKRLATDKLLAALHSSTYERNRLLMQFLRARQHNAHDALRMINDTLGWRGQVGIEKFLLHSASNLTSPDACFPMHILSSPEKCKQPVVYGLIRLLDKKKAEKVPFHNALLSFLESVYYAHTYVLDEMIIILDFRDWSIRRHAPYRLVKDGIQTLQDYYPERLGRVFLVHYPTSIRAAYTAVSPIIDPGAKEKIVWVADADPSSTLKKYVAPKSIPKFMGGELEAKFPHNWPNVAAEYEVHKSTQHGLFHH